MEAPTSRLSDKGACLADSARTFCQSTVGVEAGGLGTGYARSGQRYGVRQTTDFAEGDQIA